MLIIIDFETYYDSVYSLSNMTTIEYIMDPRFEVIGVSIIIPDYELRIFVRSEHVERVLREIPFHCSTMVSHNAKFDASILAYRYHIHPKWIADTESMSLVSGLALVAGGSSLAILSKYLISQGEAILEKGTTVHDMIGVHADDMTEEQFNAYGRYCITDSDNCLAIYRKVRPHITQDECRMIHITMQCMTKPVFALNTELLERYVRQLSDDRAQTLSRIANTLSIAPRTTGVRRIKVETREEVLQGILRSSMKFVELLKSLDVEVPYKYGNPTKKYPKGVDETGKPRLIPAVSKTDVSFIEMMEEHPDPFVRELCTAKLEISSSIADSRANRFLRIGRCYNKIPVPLRYASAHTLRYGGADKINLQNLPKRGGDTTLRRSIIAPEGHMIVAADSSQIECRLNAYSAQEERLLRVFADGGDPYCFMAAGIYGAPYEQIYRDSKVEPTHEGKLRRAVGKETVLACGYQMGGDRFALRLKQQGIPMSEGEPARIVQIYRRENSAIARQWATAQDILQAMVASPGCTMTFGGPNNNLFRCYTRDVFGKQMVVVELPNSTYLRYNNLRVINEDDRQVYVYDQLKGREYVRSYIYGGKLVENVIQALSFAILKWQALEMYKAGVTVKLNVHDEWVTCVPNSEVERTKQIIGDAMKRVPDYVKGLPVDCEVSLGASYGDME